MSGGARQDPRRRTTVMFGGVAAGMSAFFAAAALYPIAVEEITGSARWSGLPAATGIVGAAAGAVLLTRLGQRQSRRTALVTGYLVASAGALTSVAGLAWDRLDLLILGAALIGPGMATNQLTRYVAADQHERARRARILSLIVWTATIGGLVGPNVLGPAGWVAERAALPETAGGYLFAAALFGIVALTYLFALPPGRGLDAIDDTDDQVEPLDPGESPWGLARVRVALLVLVTGQAVMVLIMTMTPVHLKHSGADLAGVGVVMSFHIVGMYVLSPVAGWAVGRFGPMRTAVFGFVQLAGAGIAAATVPPGAGELALPLALLGTGWSFGFVAGSALLTEGLAPRVRVAMQGNVEAAVFLASALSSLLAGVLLEAIGYAGIGFVGTALTVLMALFLSAQRGRLALERA